MTNKASELPRGRGRPRKIDLRSPEQRKSDLRAYRLQKANAGLALLAVAPDTTRIRRHTVLASLGISDTTLWRRIREHKFPAPHRDGRIASWSAGEIRAALSGGTK